MKWATIPALVLWALSASASDDLQALTLSGFATLGVVATDKADMRFTRVGIDRPGTERPDTGPDSVLGVQGNLRLGESSSAVVQVVSRENTKGNYAPRPTLAFLSHQVTPELSARAGRLRIPFFMQSDSLNINYAHPWVRPPEEVYGLSPFADLDGIDLLYRVRAGETDIELHPFFGTSRLSLYPDTKARLKRVAGANLTLSHGDLSVHLGHAEARLEINWQDPFYTALAPVLRDLGRDDIVARMAGNDGTTRFSSAGFQWDDGRWLVIGEYARRQADRYANSAHGWQLTAGHRFGTVMPYMVVARHIQDAAVVDMEDVRSLPPLPGLAELISGFNASRNLAQHSVTAGVRWDVHSNAAVKAEFTRARTDANAWGTFDPSNETAASHMGGRSINILSLSVDVTF